MKKPSLKFKIYGLLITYMVSWLGQSWMPFLQSSIFANEKKANINIVALLVDKDLYNGSLKDDINRYASRYIQSKLSNSRAIIFPLNTTTIHAQDIAKMLENIYYDGVEKQPSTLQWVILIGDHVPLPIVNDKGTIFPTIFPYVDFDDPKYYRDPSTKFFVPNQTSVQPQAEIRESMIALGNDTNAYTKFFTKLKSYEQDPSHYIGTKVWYDDFIDQKQSFNKTNFPDYINKFSFAEDLAYHRYHPLLIDLRNTDHNAKTTQLAQNLASLTGTDDSYAHQVSTVFSGLLEDYNANSWEKSTQQVPTVFVNDALQGFQKSYQELYGVTSVARMRDNILAAGRRSTSDIDTHASKIEYYDQLYTKQLGEDQVPLLTELNKKLEDTIITSVQQKQYPLHIGIPVKATIQKHAYTRLWSGTNLPSNALSSFLNIFQGTNIYYNAGIYEAFYYGKNASTITGIDQTSIFLWTPNPLHNNLTNLSQMSWIDTKQSIGASYGILSQFVEANRGYVTTQDLIDYDMTRFNNGKCNNNFTQYRDQFLWGNTPLNLTGTDQWLELVNKRYDRGGISNRVLLNGPLLGTTTVIQSPTLQAGSIFNIAGSRAITSPQDWMFSTRLQGWYLQRIVYEDIEYNPFGIFTNMWTKKRKQVDTCDPTQNDAEPLTHHDISSATGIYQTWYYKEIRINDKPLLTSSIPCPTSSITGSVCNPYPDKPAIPAGEYLQKQYLDYKTIDSLSLHTSPTPDQVEQFITTTPDRPIDSIRYITFKGIGGDRVKFILPNLYAIEVYKINPIDSGQLILKTKDEIKSTIRQYLQNIIIQYNTNLTEQIVKQPGYYNSQSSLFSNLGTIDPLATPARNYTLLDTNLLSHTVSDDLIDTIAQLLWIENSLLPKKQITTNLSDELQQLSSNSSISPKKQAILSQYITKQNPATILSLPWYEPQWYELINLTSDGDDGVESAWIPADVLRAQSQIDDYTTYQSQFSHNQDDPSQKDLLNEPCASKYGEPVPLVDLTTMKFPWFTMFACRLEHIGKPKLTFNFNNALGPVFTQHFFQDSISDIKEQYGITTSPEEDTPKSSTEQSLLQNVNIKVNPSVYLLDPDTPASLQPQIVVQKKNGFSDPIKISLSSSGANCIEINNHNTCTNPTNISVSNDALVIPLSLDNKKSGYTTLTIKTCTNESVCTQQTFTLQIAPGPITTAHISLPYSNILSKSTIPFVVQAQDEYHNMIPFSLLPIKISLSTGVIDYGTSMMISDFRTIQERQLPATDTSLDASLIAQNKDLSVLWDTIVHVASGSVQITSQDNYFSSANQSITYSLPKKKSLLYINKNFINLNVVPKLSLNLLDNQGKHLGWVVDIQSEYGTFTLGQIDSFNPTIIPLTGIQTINSISFSTGAQHLILIPTGRSWRDNIIISYPDGHKQVLPVTVLPATEAAQVKIIPTEPIKLSKRNDSLHVKVFAYDDRGNSMMSATVIKNKAYGSLHFSWASEKLSFLPAGWSALLTISTDDIGWNGYIVSTIANSSASVPWVLSTKVEQSIIPQGNINGLYLNIMWSDRGNIYNINNNTTTATQLLTNSDKLLAITTQLTDPTRMKQAVLQVYPNGTTVGNQINDRIITTRQGNVIAQNINKQTEITLGPISNYQLNQSIKETTIVYPEDSSLIVTHSWAEGSSNSEQIITLIDINSSYNPTTLSSLQDASDPDKNIWRRSSQDHLTQFGQGKIVGDATRTNSSEYVINFWDPLLTRISHNTLLSGSNLDDGPGQTIVNEPSRTILKSFSLDINNDSLQDIVTVFSNGDVIWSKQYGGKQAFVDMGPLLKIFGTIYNVYGVNAKGDGYGDIIVEGENHKLRIYTNKWGIFDVDGFPVCINDTAQQANSLDDIDQWFVDDMDNDGQSDIIINQAGKVEIIYGGKVGNSYSYISKNHDSCDTNRSYRKSQSHKIVDTLETKFSEKQIVDSSLIRRKGLYNNNDTTSGSQEDTTTSDNPYLTNTINQALTGMSGPQFWNFPFQDITDQATSNLLRRSTSPIDYVPSYEPGLQSSELKYLTISQLNTTDQIHVYKTYTDLNGGTLQKWDDVKVTVSIYGLRNDPMTYIDRIQWPWIVQFSKNWAISWRESNDLPSSATYRSINPQGWYMFVVDNIWLGSQNSASFSYHLTYQWGSSTKITITDRNHDDYKDISMYPLDGCSKFLRTFLNTKSLLKSYRDYTKEFINLEQKLQNYNNWLETTSQNYLSGMTNTIMNITGATWSDAQTIKNILNTAWSEHMSFGNFFSSLIQNGGLTTTLNLNSINQVASNINNQVRDAIQKICNGKVWWGGQSCKKWLPIPRNTAFLAPGEFNIMGCKPKFSQIDNLFPQDGGFPIFAFPATLTTPVWPIPLPFPRWGFQKWATDSYGYFWFPTAWWTYPSQIRIYVAPTTTQQMGMAICLWPQTVGKKIPKPFSALGWNCIVTKVNLGWGSCSAWDNGWEDSLSDQDYIDLSQFGQCTQPKKTNQSTSNSTTAASPFELTNTTNGNYSDPFPPGTYFGLINLEKTPIVLGEDSTSDGVVLRWGKEVNPQVQGGKKSSKWLIWCIVNDWLDRQTNYIINNFTNMQIGVYLPDLSQLGQWFNNLNDNFDKMKFQTGYIDRFTDNFWTSGDSIQSTTDTFSGKTIEAIRNMTINKSSLQWLEEGINNPFQEIAKLFEQTPLIRINPVDIPVSIPMIYAEDIVKYESYLKSWTKRNKEILADRQSIIQGTLGICGKNYDLIGNSNSNTIQQPPILSKEFFKQLFQKLKKEKDSLKEKIEKKKKFYKELNECKQQKRDSNSESCKIIMSNFWVKQQELSQLEIKLNQGEKINNQCTNLFFWPNGDINANFTNLLSITEKFSGLETNVRANMKTLDQYKRFPLQLYQRTHIVDRYLNEITATVDGFLGYLTIWLNTNATRFEQYVDAIITISTALETWQTIINLSVDWQKKCSTCTVDNYDAYACSLGFLCGQLKLPILRLPPFKIPNIYIDLSHIDLGMDINLPNFKFTPTSVDLVTLPDLPQPPSISINGNIGTLQLEKIANLLTNLNISLGAQIPWAIPTIPLLPSPPTLPELPSFIPNVNLELPILPPAPKIPKLAPEIQTVIKAVSFFSELYCIVKGGIGLVGESNVKTRIEQLTQRTYEIPLFDNINLSRDMSYQQDKLEGFDIKIDAFVNFTMNFNGVYTLIKWLADSVNQQTEKLIKRQGDQVESLNKDIQHAQNEVQNYSNQHDLNSITDGQNITLNNPLGFDNQTETTSITQEKKNIGQALQFLQYHNDTPQDKKVYISKLKQRIADRSTIKPQTAQILALQQSVHQSLQQSHQSLDQLQKKIQNYDKFIDDISTHSNYSIINGTGKEFSIALLKWNNTLLHTPINIMKDYTVLQKTLLWFYNKGLDHIGDVSNQSTVSKIKKEIAYLDKGLSLSEQIYTTPTHNQSYQQLKDLQQQYDAEKNLTYNNQAASCSNLWGYNSTNSSNNSTPKLVNSYPSINTTAQVGGNSTYTPSSSVDSTYLYDFSEYNNRIMVNFPTTSGDHYIDTVSSDYLINRNKWYEYSDINGDNGKDILRRDDNHVWIKYANQNPSQILPIHTSTITTYVAPIRDTVDQRSRLTTQWYLILHDIKLKVSDQDRSVKNLQVNAQDYDSFTISRTNSNRQQSVSWYLIEINTIPDLYHLKWYGEVPKNLASRYVLFLPEGADTTQGFLSLENQLPTQSFERLLTGTLLQIVSYNPDSETLHYSFTDIPKSWYYTRIASIAPKWSSQVPIYTLSSPWSHHVVAGQQIIADEQGPEPTVQLHRILKNTISDSGLSPNGFVNTHYNILINREDPNGVGKNRVSNESGQLISSQSGSAAIISGLYFEFPTTRNFTIWATDTNGNISKENIHLTINVPTISLDDIVSENTPEGISLLSSLSDKMDDGMVKFQKKRNATWSNLINTIPTQSFIYPLTLDQTFITGWLYNQSHAISLFAPNGETIATLSKENGSITISDTYANRITKKVSLLTNTPLVLLYDTQSNRNLFTIKLKQKNLSLTAQPPYHLQILSGSVYGSFSGGSCIASLTNQCMIIASPQNTLIIPAPYHTTLQWEYQYTNSITTINFSNSTLWSVWSASFTAFL